MMRLAAAVNQNSLAQGSVRRLVGAVSNRDRSCCLRHRGWKPLPQTDRSFPDRRSAFTLVELLVVIAIIVMLVALLLPAVQGARRKATAVACLSNMHQCVVAAQSYGVDFGDFPYSWRYDVPHPESMSVDYLKVYDNNTSTHFSGLREGDCFVAYWTYYLVDLRYATARTIGCAFRPPTGWFVWPGEQYSTAGGVTCTNLTQIRNAPTYIYRGPNKADDLRTDIYACGQIGYSSIDPATSGRSGAFYPHAASATVAPLFHCPLFTDQKPVTGFENYASTHSGLRRGVRNRATFPLGDRLNHYVDETVGFTDGSAKLCTQPNDSGVYFVDYNGNISTSPASGM